MRELPSIGTLTRSSWSQFLHDWNQTFTITAWYLLIPSVMLALSILMRETSDRGIAPISLLAIVNIVLTIWTSIRLYRWILAKDRGATIEADEARLAWHWFFPFLLVAVLESLAILGGTALLLLPGIWLYGLLLFSKMILLESGTRGTHALAMSAHLVRGRWWPIFVRFIVPTLLFLLLSLSVLSLMAGAIGAIAGFPKLGVVLRGDNTDPVAAAVQLLLQSLVQAAFLPLFATLQVKLFHACKATK
jgi:hypothetical protein